MKFSFVCCSRVWKHSFTFRFILEAFEYRCSFKDAPALTAFQQSVETLILSLGYFVFVATELNNVAMMLLYLLGLKCVYVCVFCIIIKWPVTILSQV